MNLKDKVLATLAGLKKARNKQCGDFEPDAVCIAVKENISLSLYELLLTHPQFSWLVTDLDVRATISVRDPTPYSAYNSYHTSLVPSDDKNVSISVERRERKCSC